MDFIPSCPRTLNLISSGLRPEHFPRIAVSLFHQERADDQRIHARAEKRAHRIGGRIDDGLTAQVKRRIHDDRHARAVAEFFDQSPVERIHLLLDGLRARGAIHVSDRRDNAVFLWPHRKRQNHERRVWSARQVLAGDFGQHRGRERAPPLAELHGVVDRKSTCLNSSHGYISYAVFCLKKKKQKYAELMYEHESMLRLI